MTKLTKDTYKRGGQTVVYNNNIFMYQVQTWTGSNWYGFVNVDSLDVEAEKRKQLADLPNHPS
jgi:hypothetical protein